MSAEATRSPRLLYAILLAWGAIALAAGAVGAVARAPVPVPVILAGLVAAGILAWRLSGKVRGWVRAVPPRALVAIHLVRFVGAWFVVLYRRGELPFAFAVPGGWGDIVVAAGAAGLLLGAFPAHARGRRAILYAWNTLGLLDILFVVTTAARLFFAEAGQLAPLTRLPLSLLPTYFVPLIVLSHLRIFGWLRETSRAGGATSRSPHRTSSPP
ncbi:MAG TPA: hypothetical protein VFH11_04575 [Gemmatimonadota bacterium]|nr:hypothetical protein [Gemmatimonadota bacterium]